MTTISAGTTQHSVLDAILNRRSVVTFKPECPPREVIERLIEAAVTAPNHYLNQPWRFLVVAGRAREAYGDFLADLVRQKQADPTSPEVERLAEAERAKPLRSPVLIVGAATRKTDDKAPRQEDIAATAAALEHMLLAAPALGLGAYWRTGDPAYDPRVKAYLGLKEEDDIVGFLYVGYPDMTRQIKPRQPILEKTDWRGWD